MPTTRLEAFSDGVIAVIITIMVLELRPPNGTDLNALNTLVPSFIVYLYSFITLGIYWNNHHHLLYAAKHINAKIMWANLFLLLCLSLVPYGTLWLGENYQAILPTVVYGCILFMSGLAYFILQRQIVLFHPKELTLKKRLRKDTKGLISMLLYLSAILLAYLNPLISDIIYVAVAIMWFIPDRRLLGEELERHNKKYHS